MAEQPAFPRRDLAVMGLSAAALMAMQATGNTQEKRRGERVSQGHESGFDACAAACNDCQLECHACAHHCMMLVSQGKKDHLLTLQTCIDCADICSTAGHITARKGPFSNTICEACADACDKCAKECEKFSDDEHMARCAKECRKCEKACRDMVKNAGQDLVR